MLEGRQIGHYLLRQQIGSGGMGTVYLAQDSRTTKVREIAVKVVALAAMLKPEELEHKKHLFRREIEAIVRLDHPHILPLFDFGTESFDKEEYLYLVIPYRPQGSLRDWLDEHQPVPLPTISSILIQAANALHYVHKRGIIHRDVKPSNFLIRERVSTADLGEPYPFLQLADFGLARFSTTSSDQGMVGTPQFMAPEQWQERAVPSSDQYALAAMAFKLFTGQYIFQGRQAYMMYQHHFTPPPSLRSLRPDLPPEVDAVMARALSKEPEKRFSTITNFVAALHQALGLPHDINSTLPPNLPSFGLSPSPSPAPTIGPTLPPPPSEQDLASDKQAPSVDDSNTSTQPLEGSGFSLAPSSESSTPKLVQVTLMSTSAPSDIVEAEPGPVASLSANQELLPPAGSVQIVQASVNRSQHLHSIALPGSSAATRQSGKRLRRFLPMSLLLFVLLAGGVALIIHPWAPQSTGGTHGPGTPNLAAASPQSTLTTITKITPMATSTATSPSPTPTSRPPEATPTPTPTAPSGPPPFTFEDGGVDGWSNFSGVNSTECSVSNSTDVGGYPTGTHALKIVVNVDSLSAGPSASVNVPNGPEAGGQISTWLYLPAADNGKIESIDLFARDPTGAWRGITNGPVYPNTFGRWFQVSGNMGGSYTGHATRVGITFTARQTNTDIPIYIDDVTWSTT